MILSSRLPNYKRHDRRDSVLVHMFNHTNSIALKSVKAVATLRPEITEKLLQNDLRKSSCMPERSRNRIAPIESLLVFTIGAFLVMYSLCYPKVWAYHRLRLSSSWSRQSHYCRKDQGEMSDLTWRSICIISTIAQLTANSILIANVLLIFSYPTH